MPSAKKKNYYFIKPKNHCDRYDQTLEYIFVIIYRISTPID